MNDLHTKYRPIQFAQIVGQTSVVASLKNVIKDARCRAFLLTGPAGVGKTTLARIIAAKVGCLPRNLVEVDAATNSGIEAMRAITEGAQYSGLGDSAIKVIIIDEAHALSSAAWQSLLKAVEEPPRHVFWVFCTTNASKIPNTIQTRCTCYTLDPIKSDDIFDCLKGVVKEEKLKASDEVLDLIAKRSDGSMRRALTFLAQCADIADRGEASAILKTMADETDVIELCRGLIKGNLTWDKACGILKTCKETNGEGIRNVVVAYFTKVALDASADRAGNALAVIEAFGTPYPSNAGIYPVLLSLGKLLLT